MSGSLPHHDPSPATLQTVLDLPAELLRDVGPICPPPESVQRYLQIASSGELVWVLMAAANSLQDRRDRKLRFATGGDGGSKEQRAGQDSPGTGPHSSGSRS